MQKVPVESLGLFEQLDRTVVAFLKKKTSPNPDNFYVSISEEDYEKKKEEFEKFMKLSSLAIKNKELTKAIRKLTR